MISRKAKIYGGTYVDSNKLENDILQLCKNSDVSSIFKK
jgi:hypothetical protein